MVSVLLWRALRVVILTSCTTSMHGAYTLSLLTDIPEWNTVWTEKMIEVKLVAVRMFRDPFTLDPNKLVLCEVFDYMNNPGGRWGDCFFHLHFEHYNINVVDVVLCLLFGF